ncbi:MAG: UxaA family hydrolase [Deltaproteobacteria bacterium]|nr:UxaA family hydrolase [Deltaproteobacteria bacterium]
MTRYAKKIAPNDNVATAVADCAAGDAITVKFQGVENTYSCRQDIPFGHKIAVSKIRKGEPVIKYGEPIGTAYMEIGAGDWVHTHNLRDDYLCLDKEGNPLPGQ